MSMLRISLESMNICNAEWLHCITKLSDYKQDDAYLWIY